MHIVGLDLDYEIDLKRAWRSGQCRKTISPVFEKYPNPAIEIPVQNTSNPKPVIDQITAVHQNPISKSYASITIRDFGAIPPTLTTDQADQYMQRRKR